MSDAEADSEGVDAADYSEDGAETDAEPETEDNGIPSLDDSETVDMSDALDMAADDLDSSSDDSEEASTDSRSEKSESDLEGSKTDAKWGDMYCKTVVQVTNSVVESQGGEANALSIDDARELDLDDHFNEVLREMDLSEEMSPQAALMSATALLVFGAIIAETDAGAQAIDRIMNGANPEQ
ncbi:hypothetical protein ACFQJC_14530 [Haloferax namakaokahaiae]|uniref:Uncharacterized protein n=1 Tax=Haloferax namakaokahaiae TaxID=1748331 RepID=A0ABD5ZHN5_9EURY